MEQNKLDFYRQQIVEHILTTKDTFNDMTLLERFECAQKVMELTKAYCCELFSLDSSKVKTCFIHGSNMGGIAGGRISEAGFSAMALTTKKVAESTSIYSLYRTALHEFKHLDQINNMTPEDRETISHYTARNEFNRFKWASSPSEGSADQFAFREVLGLQRAILKQTDHRFRACAEYVSWCDKSLTSRAEHVGSEILYSVLSPFMRDKTVRHIGDKIDTPKDPNDPTRMLTMFQVKSMAQIDPDLFTSKPFRPKDKSMIKDFKSSVDAYYEVQDILEGFKGSGHDFSVQGFDAEGNITGEEIVLNADELLYLDQMQQQAEQSASESVSGEQPATLSETTQPTPQPTTLGESTIKPQPTEISTMGLEG